jgi:hypothetical protein
MLVAVVAGLTPGKESSFSALWKVSPEDSIVSMDSGLKAAASQCHHFLAVEAKGQTT